VILDIIAQSVGISREYLDQLAQTASHRYKTYTIPKRTGGTRTIHHPSKELKFLQRWLVDNLFAHLHVHESVYSYRPNRSIRQHAEIHRKHNFLLRIDFADFFPSIGSMDIKALLKRHERLIPIDLVARDYGVIASIVCRNGKLTIGAPSSPVLSNAVMYEFDRHWAKYCDKRGVTYSRYADDVYFSTSKPNILETLLRDMRSWLKENKSPCLRLNEKKTEYTSRKRKRVVTGLVLTSENKVSIGRKKKRYIKGLVLKATQGMLDEKNLAYLRGYLAYLQNSEPSFIERLERKYGQEPIRKIRKVNEPA
jgi:RNA-directed DNA polymerase